MHNTASFCFSTWGLLDNAEFKIRYLTQHLVPGPLGWENSLRFHLLSRLEKKIVSSKQLLIPRTIFVLAYNEVLKTDVKRNANKKKKHLCL